MKKASPQLGYMKTIKLLILALLITACKTTMEKVTFTSNDPHSYSKPSEAVVKHLKWTATVNFESKQLDAIAEWKIEAHNQASVIVFDTKGLSIEKIFVDGKPGSFTLSEPDAILGRALTIDVAPTSKTVTIHYKTGPDAEALQWLSAQQTAGKVHPFLFTQSQAILARSWIPTQDSPGIRFTYEADVTVPSELLALMSASNPQTKNERGVYHFEMKQPIPSYLLALAVGDIEFESISERSGIYAEPAVIKKAVYEFADLEKMIAGAEELYGPYAWERYDVLVLPPSFPFGGMENPRLTFATPTILSGDRSLVSLIAHELAHSWSGNLVTNATWSDFWLNEGFTVYFEHRIMEKLYGSDYSEMLSSLALQGLHDEISSMVADSIPDDTKLKLDLSGRNPDDGVTSIAYDKGYFFLRSIEEKYGREYFDAFLKDYFSQNAFKVMNTEEFIDFIKTYYKTNFNIALDDARFDNWIYSEGLPEDHPEPSSLRFKKVDDLIASWKAEKKLDQSLAKDWSTHEWLHFLKNLPADLNQAQMTTLDAFGNFTNTGNAEILTAWGVLVYHNQYQKAYPQIESFLINTGRRKFLSPLYTELVKTVEGKKLAKAIYEKARPNYHFVATNTFDKMLK
jgi:leukotriene-A4 hydrolase